MALAPCLSGSSHKYLGSAESVSHSRRLSLLREQLVRENRRSAAPISHPFASRGPLQALCNQIRDVSRIADAIAIGADSASEGRLQELCSDLRRLLQTQQRWTERLENQIWRLESQGKLMRRLQQVLQQGSPGTDQIWELCEVIARETQALPDGLILLPEPGHRIALAQEGTNSFAGGAIEKARLCVFAGMSILPNIRGADLAAATFLSCINSYFASLPALSDPAQEAELRRMRVLSEAIGNSSSIRPLCSEDIRLVDVVSDFAEQLEQHSLKSADTLVPAEIREYYAALVESWPSSLQRDEASRELARSLCSALGLSDSVCCRSNCADQDEDEGSVLFHKLSWHKGQKDIEFAENSTSEFSEPAVQPSKAIRRSRFLHSSPSHGPVTKFRVFSEE